MVWGDLPEEFGYGLAVQLSFLAVGSATLSALLASLGTFDRGQRDLRLFLFLLGVSGLLICGGLLGWPSAGRWGVPNTFRILGYALLILTVHQLLRDALTARFGERGGLAGVVCASGVVLALMPGYAGVPALVIYGAAVVIQALAGGGQPESTALGARLRQSWRRRIGLGLTGLFAIVSLFWLDANFQPRDSGAGLSTCLEQWHARRSSALTRGECEEAPATENAATSKPAARSDSPQHQLPVIERAVALRPEQAADSEDPLRALSRAIEKPSRPVVAAPPAWANASVDELVEAVAAAKDPEGLAAALAQLGQIVGPEHGEVAPVLARALAEMSPESVVSALPVVEQLGEAAGPVLPIIRQAYARRADPLGSASGDLANRSGSPGADSERSHQPLSTRAAEPQAAPLLGPGGSPGGSSVAGVVASVGPAVVKAVAIDLERGPGSAAPLLAEALAQLGETGVPALVMGLELGDSQERAAALRALEQMGALPPTLTHPAATGVDRAEFGSSASPEGGRARDLEIRDDTFFVASWTRGLVVSRDERGRDPVPVAQISTPGIAAGVALFGDYAVVADYTTLRIFDISEPARPLAVAALGLPGVLLDVEVVGPYAYVGAWQAGLQVVNLENPRAPRRVAGLAVFGKVSDVEVRIGRAYLAAGKGGCVVVDVTTPSRPREIGAVRDAGDVRGVGVWGDRVWLAGVRAGVQLYDLEDPSSPRQLAHYPDLVSAVDVEVDGDRAYVAAGRLGVWTLDLRDAENPELLTTQLTSGVALAVRRRGSRLYLANDRVGVTAIDLPDRVAQSGSGPGWVP